jgi:hypothetical protein
MFTMFSDNIVAKPLCGSAVAYETEDGCVDALIEETPGSLGDLADVSRV